MRFVNRDRELHVLDDFHAREGFQFLPLYGRRRVGKTTLAREFIRREGGIYYLCRQVADKDQLASLGRAIGGTLQDSFLAQRGFGTWDQFFDYLAAQCAGSKDRLLLVLDEYPYLAASNKGISSLFQQAIDERLGGSSLFLILCGSQRAMMEREVLGYKAPLYGRRTGQLKVEPFSYPEAIQFFPENTPAERMAYYSICGGIPAYLSKLDPSADVRDNIIRNFGTEEEFLCQEPEFMLRQELYEVRYYFSLIQAIARGHRKLGLLVNETGLAKSLVGKYLKTLVDLHILEREVPILEPNPDRSRRGLYRIRDNLFDFYFRFIFPNRHLLGVNEGNLLYEQVIAPHFDSFVSFKAEDAARDLVRVEFPELARIGRQWDRNNEIDIVGLTSDGGVSLIGEVKYWQDKPVGLNVLTDLYKKAENLGINPEKTRIILFSASGFTPALKKRDVLLRDF